MQIHSVGNKVLDGFIEKMKEQSQPSKKVEQFTDPLREFSRASRLAGTVAAWLTYSIDARKAMIRENFNFNPQGSEEKDKDFQSRQMERWRALCVIIQEESRAEAGVRSAEVAIAALKHLFPEHPWKTPTAPKEAA